MKAALLFGSAFAALTLVAGPVAAQDADPAVTFTGSAALVSNYTFRGISQTSNEAAIQAGIMGAAPEGIYAGIWGSSLNFGEPASLVTSAQGGSMELDLIAGIRPAVGPLTLDLGAVFYDYPGTASSLNYNYWEFAAALSHSFPNFSLAAKGVYSPDFFAGSGHGVYFGGSVGIPIPNTTLALSGSVGHQGIETNGAFGTPDYMDWTAGATVGVLGVTLGATAVGTDLSEAECFGGSELCKAQVLFSVSK